MEVPKLPRVLLLVSCLSFVIYKSGQCILKYTSKPTGIDLSLENGVYEKSPQFTFCVKLNVSVLNQCGITLDEYEDEGLWANLSGPDFCKSPSQVLEKARVNLETVVTATRISYDAQDDQFIYLNDTNFWTVVDDPTGTCNSFYIPPKFHKHSVSEIRFYLGENAYKLYITTPGYLFSNPRRVSYCLKKDISQTILLNYDIFKIMGHQNDSCIEDEKYTTDKCYKDQAFENMMRELNCTWPFFQTKDHICTDIALAKRAMEIGEIYHKKHLKVCKWPCEYIKVMVEGNVKEKMSEKLYISFSFKETVKVLKSYYIYNELSLIAEIGGYVGLFLGWSVYQITDLPNYFIKLKQQFF